jgi:hypothetical protein
MYDLETQAKVQSWRMRAAGHGEPLTEDEMLEAVKLMRGPRMSAQVASDTSKTKAKRAAGPALDGDDLLAEMGG